MVSLVSHNHLVGEIGIIISGSSPNQKPLVTGSGPAKSTSQLPRWAGSKCTGAWAGQVAGEGRTGRNKLGRGNSHRVIFWESGKKKGVWSESLKNSKAIFLSKRHKKVPVKGTVIPSRNAYPWWDMGKLGYTHTTVSGLKVSTVLWIPQ